MIDLFGEPPTASQIEAWQKTAAEHSEVKFDDSIGKKVALFTPIPGVDMLAGFATYAVESALRPDLTAPLRAVTGGTARVWPEGSVAEAYVQKVRAQGRELIRAEVAALEHAANLDAMTKVVADASVRHFSNAVLNALSSMQQGAVVEPTKGKSES